MDCVSFLCDPLASYILLQWQDSYCALGLYHILIEQGYELRAQGFYTKAIKSLFR